MYQIFLSFISETTVGTTTVSLCIFIVFSDLVFASIYIRVTVVPFGQRIISTASSEVIQTTDFPLTEVIISPAIRLFFCAGEFSRTFIICIPFIFSCITAPIPSKSP